MLVEKSPISTYPTFIWRPRRGVTRCNFAETFGTRKVESLGYIVRRYLREPTLSRFGTVPACDRRTDRQTDDDSIYRASIAWRGK